MAILDFFKNVLTGGTSGQYGGDVGQFPSLQNALSNTFPLNYPVVQPVKPTAKTVATSPSASSPSTSGTSTYNTALSTPAAKQYISSNLQGTTQPDASVLAYNTQQNNINTYGDPNKMTPIDLNTLKANQATLPQGPSAYDTAKADYMKAYEDYIQTLNPSAEVTKAQTDYNNYVANANAGISGLEGQGRGIPLSLIRGQQAKLRDQALQKEALLQGDINIAQGVQTQRQNVGAANVSLKEKLLGLERNPNDLSNLPASAQEYEYAKRGGYAGSYSDYQNEDANRKAGVSGTEVSPATLQGMLNVYKATGVVPALGLGSSPLRQQFYAALGGADGSTVVNDAQATKAIRSGLTTAYKTQQNQLAANQTSISTLDKQLTLAQQYSDQVNRTDSPLVNKYLIAARTGVFGDPQTAALNNIITTAAYEFAKILSGAAASIGGVSISSADDAKNLLNSAMSKGQFNEVLSLMRKEAQYRLDSQTQTVRQLESDMKNLNTGGSISSNTSSGGFAEDWTQ